MTTRWWLTGLSIAVAFRIGSIELIGILHDQLDLADPVSAGISGIDLNNIGVIIVGLFVVVWAVALTFWKLAKLRSDIAGGPNPTVSTAPRSWAATRPLARAGRLSRKRMFTRHPVPLIVSQAGSVKVAVYAARACIERPTTAPRACESVRVLKSVLATRIRGTVPIAQPYAEAYADYQRRR
ncbi:hypothetical protein AB0L97_36615 [Nocardia sp. NPDC051911]|uniref:HoxN/HupN/NixA family nickel/cobalt transporter n=1 Tax=Nocardia sp. NPDC051911 TaxID=3154648 RepID=UPI00342C1F37